MNPDKIKIKSVISILFSLIILSSINIFSQINSNDTFALGKRGGVTFRVDDNANISEYRKMAEIFEKYNAKFSIALNLNDFKTPEYKDSIRSLQDMGIEILDHTPNHRTNYFYTIFPLTDYKPTQSSFRSGVDHIIGNKICLAFEPVDTLKADRNGVCSLTSNLAISEFGNLSDHEAFIFFPQINKLALINSIKNDSLYLVDVWDDSIDLGIYTNINYQIFTRDNVHLTEDALKLLVNETWKLADEFKLKRPKIWIQPGGKFPQIKPDELKNVIGDQMGYIGGSGYTEYGREVYNEYNPLGSERFSMQWGDFFEDKWSLEKCKNTIADRVAKHYLQINHLHFYDLPGTLNDYLMKLDSLLAWVSENNIPIKTYSEWATILYDSIPNPLTNIIPPLNIDADRNVSDLDVNGVPDGYVNRYWSGQGRWAIDTIINGEAKYCYEITTDSRITRIEDLAGVEKGENEFKIKTRGAPGDSIEVRFIFRDLSGVADAVYKFPADTEEWKEYSLEESFNGNSQLIIPDSATFISIDIICSDYVSGTVAVTDMYLAKDKLTGINGDLPVVQNKFQLNQNYPNPFNPVTKIGYNITNKSQVTLKVYDILGRLVETLINSNQDAGYYSLSFDASNLTSGIYFYTLSAGNFVETKKMILMK